MLSLWVLIFPRISAPFFITKNCFEFKKSFSLNFPSSLALFAWNLFQVRVLSVTKNIFSLSLAIGLLFGAISAQATEQEHLAQAIKSVGCSKLSLQRAAASAKGFCEKS